MSNKKRIKKNKAATKSAFPHFRYYKKSKHPALITGEFSEREYRFRKVMHAEKDGKRSNEIVYPNPDPRDSKPMYIAKRIRHDKKQNFEDRILPWQYPQNKDKKK